MQVGHGEAAPREGEDGGAAGGARQVFGVSATAAVYRRSALDEVGLFDERLVSWYEDVDLAVRLRAAGWRALHVPAARALHAGGATARRLSWRYGRLLYGNRWLVGGCVCSGAASPPPSRDCWRATSRTWCGTRGGLWR